MMFVLELNFLQFSKKRKTQSSSGPRQDPTIKSLKLCFFIFAVHIRNGYFGMLFWET
jgi:hypothetical protein